MINDVIYMCDTTVVTNNLSGYWWNAAMRNTAGHRNNAHKEKASNGINRWRFHCSCFFLVCFRSLVDLFLFYFCLIVSVFARSIALLFAFWFDQLLCCLMPLNKDLVWSIALLLDATEQGCAKIFIYDTIQFWLSDMRQCEGALPRYARAVMPSVEYLAQ